MVHHDVQAPTFDEFFLAEFPRLVSMLTAWSGDRSVAEDLPLADIAAALGCSDGSVKSHLQRARRSLAGHLSSDTGTPQ